MRLDYSWRGLTEVPIEEILEHKKEVTVLILSDNKITSLPLVLFKEGVLSNLEVLYLECNQLTSLPPFEEGALPNLENLYLNNNQLTYIPPFEKGFLPNLKEFYLHHNQLISLPPFEEGALPNLKYLSLYHNQLTSLPSNLVKSKIWFYKELKKEIQQNKENRVIFKKSIEEGFISREQRISKKKLKAVFVEIEGAPPCSAYFTQQNLPVFQNFKGKEYEKIYDQWI